MKHIIYLLIVIFLSNCSQFIITEKPSQTLLIAHKGVWKDGVFPANTPKAFDEALKRGFDGFELDAILTADNHFIVVHDDDLSQTTNCKGFASNLQASELTKCSSRKNSILPVTTLVITKTQNRSKVAFLTEIFEIYLPKKELKKIVIDIKSTDQERTILALKKSLPSHISQKYGHKIIFIGKSTSMLNKIKTTFPKSLTALEGEWGSEPVIDHKHYLNPRTHDFVSLNAELMFGHTKVEKNLFGRKKRNRKYLETYFNAARKANMKTIAWTINNKKNYHYLISKKVEIILTDLNLVISK